MGRARSPERRGVRLAAIDARQPGNRQLRRPRPPSAAGPDPQHQQRGPVDGISQVTRGSGWQRPSRDGAAALGVNRVRRRLRGRDRALQLRRSAGPRGAGGDSSYRATQDWNSIGAWGEPYPRGNFGQEHFVGSVQSEARRAGLAPIRLAARPQPRFDRAVSRAAAMASISQTTCWNLTGTKHAAREVRQ